MVRHRRQNSRKKYDMRLITNPQSKLLSKAIVGGTGLSLPPNARAPDGMAMVLLLVPMDEIIGKSMSEIQTDLGLPWHFESGAGAWLDDLSVVS